MDDLEKGVNSRVASIVVLEVAWSASCSHEVVRSSHIVGFVTLGEPNFLRVLPLEI